MPVGIGGLHGIESASDQSVRFLRGVPLVILRIAGGYPQGPAPDSASMTEYCRRWAVQGRRTNGVPATTIFDLLHDRRHVMVFPATLDTFAVLIDDSAVRKLAETLSTGGSCAVPAIHREYGNRLLGLRHRDSPSAVELYVVLPQKEIHIIYADERLELLAETVTHMVEWLQ